MYVRVNEFAFFANRGTTQMKIEEEMGVKIILPSSRNEDHISETLELTLMYSLMSSCPYLIFVAVVEGGSVECVTKASERISTIVDEVPYHFSFSSFYFSLSDCNWHSYF